ncbi:hypothetical protein [Paractinoplanes atraurantiacus]|uniref:DUF732 domain-containing protein n=1 Tax=Paractinoplanes atraurantiacus TaxID=1036182 RepID=A0A285H755_9ACTN|nr:hypothetical protein [Actinoplanes atraurantiacus]SNY30401.1 hypothetical protein SAMN05421748_103400 [Actinoplanes atraurantiacus]
MRQIAGVLALTVLLVTSGCSGDDEPAPVISTAATVAASSAAAEIVDDPPGTLTCTALAAAVADASLMQDGVVDGIVGASSTADAPVADAAQALAVAYTQASASKGTESEPDAVAAVSAAAADMVQVCADSGLQTVG